MKAGGGTEIEGYETKLNVTDTSLGKKEKKITFVE